MKELKTLKDLDFKFEEGDKTEEFIKGSRDAIDTLKEMERREAIKWINWLDNHSDSKEILEKETRSSEEAYKVILDKKNLEEFDKENAHKLMIERRAISKWVRDFFDIKDEDLKV